MKTGTIQRVQKASLEKCSNESYLQYKGEREKKRHVARKLFQLICQWVRIFWFIKNVLYQDDRIQSWSSALILMCGVHPCVRVQSAAPRLGKNYPKKNQLTLLVNLESFLSQKKKKIGIHSLYPSSTINSFLNPPSSSKVLILLFLSKKKKFRTAFQLSWTTEMISRHQRQGSLSLSLSLSLSSTHQIQSQ